MKLKRTSKIISVILCVVMAISILPMSAISSTAASAGSQTYSQDVVGGLQHCAVGFKLTNASIVSGNNVTYIVDRYYHKDMSSLGNIYSCNFIVNTVAYSSSFVSSGYKISNEYINNNSLISTGENTTASVEQSGYFIGDVPKAGESVEFTLTVNLSATYKYSSGNYPTDSVSASANIKVIGVDSTELQKLIVNSQALKKDCWTANSWSTYSTALTEAKAVASNSTALQVDIDNAVKNLTSAKKGLYHNGEITKCSYCKGESEGITLEPTVIRNAVYGSDPTRQSLNLYLPSNMQGEVPLILFIHGGAWFYGDKSNFDGDAYNYCKTYGVATATISYRYTSQDIDIFDILDDVDASLTKIKQLGADYGLTIKKMMLYGFSAGAHICLMYGYTRANTAPITPVCIYDMSGPTNLTGTEYLSADNENLNTWVTLFGYVCGQTFTYENRILAAQSLLNASPINYVSANCIPTILGIGVKDSIVPYQQGQKLDEMLTEAGAVHNAVYFPNSEHGLEADPSCTEQINGLIDQYIKTYLTDVMPTAVHNYEKETVAKTCTTDGYTMNTCVDCGKYFVSDIVEAGHTPGKVEKKNEKTATCFVAGGYDEVISCTVCKQEISKTHTTIPQLSHTPDKAVKESEKAPTCLLSGSYEEVVYCTTCKSELSRTKKTVEKLPHTEGTPVEENAKASTCTVAGTYDEVVYCTVCKREVSRTQKSLSLAEHKLGSWEVATPTTTSAPGLEVQKCTVCKGVINSKEIPQLTEIKITAKAGSEITIDDENNMIFGVPEGATDIDDLIDTVNCTVEYKETISGFGTGTKVRVMDGTKLVKEYTIVVPYDVTGDGYCDSFDVSLLSSVANFETEFEENSAYQYAGDVTEDEFIDSFDVSQMTAKANYEF